MEGGVELTFINARILVVFVFFGMQVAVDGVVERWLCDGDFFHVSRCNAWAITVGVCEYKSAQFADGVARRSATGR